MEANSRKVPNLSDKEQDATIRALQSYIATLKVAAFNGNVDFLNKLQVSQGALQALTKGRGNDTP